MAKDACWSSLGRCGAQWGVGIASSIILLQAALLLATCAHGQDIDVLLNSSSQSCVNDTGHPQFCAPWPPVESLLDDEDFFANVSLVASSTCNATSSASANITLSGDMFCPEGTTVQNLALNGTAINSSVRMGWYSEIFNESSFKVTIDIDLGQPYIILDIELQFPANTAPSIFLLERSSNDSTDSAFSLLQNFTETDVVNGSAMVQLANESTYYDYLENSSSIAEVGSNLETRFLRITFVEAGNTTNITGPDIATTYFVYALSSVTVRGLCQCNGHALSCTGSAGCDCEHGTAGVSCTECNTTDMSARYTPANRDTGADACQVIDVTTTTAIATTIANTTTATITTTDSEPFFTTRNIIIISASGGGGLIIIIIILLCCCCAARKRRRRRGYVMKEEITVIDATGLRQVTIKNRGFHDDQDNDYQESKTSH